MLDLKNRNIQAKQLKETRLQKIIKLQVKRPEAVSEVKKYIESPHSTKSIRSSKYNSKMDEEKVILQEEIMKDKKDLIQLQLQASQMKWMLERKHKQEIQRENLKNEQESITWNYN